jgi:hypothetical protein
MSVVKKSVAIHPIIDKGIRRVWSLLIDMGYDASYSTAINFILLGAFFEATKEEGFSNETLNHMQDFLKNKKIDEINIADQLMNISQYFSQFEKVEIQTTICTLDASGNWQIELKLKNSGSKASTLTNVFINDAEVSEYGARAPTGSAITTNLKLVPPFSIESGDIGTVKVWIGANYGKLSSGFTVNIKIHSAGGMDYIKLVQLV